jgi:hypothetical protein
MDIDISHQSKKYIEIIYTKFNSCILNKGINPKSKSFETLFFKDFYKKIKQADKLIHSDLIQHNISKNYLNIETFKHIHFPKIYNSSFLPESIKKNIEMNTLIQFIYNTKLNKRNINFHFLAQDASISHKLDTYVNFMLMWIHVLNTYGENNCSDVLDIFIFLTDAEKKLPNNNIQILDKENVNTGFTTMCGPSSEIVIYRKEEWFKVFIHETIHNFGFDFSMANNSEIHKKIYDLFPINSDFKLFESYCEAWARIINACICSYSILNNKNNMDTFILYCDFLLQIERVFSLYQTNKILEYNGINYENLYKNDHISEVSRKNLYKEHTSVFSYYIITSILLNDYGKFLKWCKNNNFGMIKFNKTPRTLNSFFNFIKNSYKSETYVETLKCIKRINKKNHFENDVILKKSLRMTILEIS